MACFMRSFSTYNFRLSSVSSIFIMLVFLPHILPLPKMFFLIIICVCRSFLGLQECNLKLVLRYICFPKWFLKIYGCFFYLQIVTFSLNFPLWNKFTSSYALGIYLPSLGLSFDVKLLVNIFTISNSYCTKKLKC